jgi:hypothetical protein
MREIQKEFIRELFSAQILTKIENPDDLKVIETSYILSPSQETMVLKDRLKESDIERIGEILDSIGFIPDDKKQKLKENYYLIESYFRKKQQLFEDYKHIPVDQVISNAPKYYSLVRLIEQLNSYVTNEPDWLKKFIEKNRISFDWQSYEKWKSGKDYYKINYDDTFAPSKWILLIQDKLIELLKSLQILLYMEYYIVEEGFKKFLKVNPEIDYKIKATILKKSYPSEGLELIFGVVDFLLKTNIEQDFTINQVVSTTVCMSIYRFLDKSGIFELLRRKEFYVKYYVEYLKRTPPVKRLVIPCEDDIISVADEFLENVRDLFYSYKEYKDRLIEKYQKVSSKVR